MGQIQAHDLAVAADATYGEGRPLVKLNQAAVSADVLRADLERGVGRFALSLAVLNGVALVGLIVRASAWRMDARSALVWGAGVMSYLIVPIAVYAWTRRAPPSPDRLSAAAALLIGAVGLVSAISDVLLLDVEGLSMNPSWWCVLLLLYGLWVPASWTHHAAWVSAAAVYLPVGAIAAHAFGAYSAGSTGSVWVSALVTSVPTWLAGVIALTIVGRAETDRARVVQIMRDLEQLGSYTLETKLGEGGMGEVWRARHAFLARPAAVKIIRPEVLGGLVGDEKARARAQLALGRFEREAKATSQLSSAHTIRVFDFGRGPNNTFFYVMELLDGLDLHTLVSRYGAQPQARVQHILLQACDSLAEAHDRGMVHRDIKPANLFLCRKGKTLDHVKVLDFGLVRSDPAAKPEGVDTLPRLTRQGIVSGSPSFMSPEQAEGADDLDRRADIYALGCVAYFLLTASEPYSHANPMVVLMQQVSAPLPPMMSRHRGLTIEPAFEALVVQMMAKRREDRPASADELRRALQALALPAAWDQDTAEKWWKRKQAPVVVEAAFEPEDMATDETLRSIRKMR